jgi:heme-degrading monooxygenase HmoA
MSADRFAKTPVPPYYAVIFTNQRTSVDDQGYGNTADRMVDLAKTMPGFLGVETTRDETGLGITVSYWQDENAIANWKANGEHIHARQSGNATWYEHYELRVAKIERAYDGPK